MGGWGRFEWFEWKYLSRWFSFFQSTPSARPPPAPNYHKITRLVACDHTKVKDSIWYFKQILKAVFNQKLHQNCQRFFSLPVLWAYVKMTYEYYTLTQILQDNLEIYFFIMYKVSWLNGRFLTYVFHTSLTFLSTDKFFITSAMKISRFGRNAIKTERKVKFFSFQSATLKGRKRSAGLLWDFDIVLHQPTNQPTIVQYFFALICYVDILQRVERRNKSSRRRESGLKSWSRLLHDTHTHIVMHTRHTPHGDKILN